MKGCVKMDCYMCERDINEIDQTNISPVFGKPLCEDCYEDMTEDEIDQLQEPYDYD